MNRLLTMGVFCLIVLIASAHPAVAQSDAEVQEVIKKFEEGDPGMQAWFKEAYGYVVFPSVGKAGFGIGGARGKGLVYEQRKLVGKSTLTQVTIGLQFGGQAFSEVVFFKDKTAFDDFTRENFEFGAQVSAVALTTGASADLAYNGGVAIVTATKGGLMYEASVGGQKFDYEKIED
ncbi:MAG: lipid-binding SYLF domain-containing protein [Candidatus Aminicenantes bacterium]|nr:lipid-binding SYLF domain-containing protein [Candidatus Aminicenantes bacterium]